MALNSFFGLGLVMVSIAMNFAIANAMSKKQADRYRFLLLGIAANIGLLFWFKANPVDAGDSGLAFLVFGVPLGLAFYCFKQITYLIDRYANHAPPLSLPRYALFSMFFAHIPAGPITPYKTLQPQLADIEHRPIAFTQIATGFSLFVVGAFKFRFFSAQFDTLTSPIYDAAARGAQVCFAEGVVASYGFLFQLYFYFSAYADMAIGLALCFGLSLSPNFDSPLKAFRPSDWIMRWHMSLMVFARAYFFSLYLGGA